VVYQDASHHFRREPKELGAVLPVDVFLIDEPKVCLIYQRRRLQCVIGKFLTKAINCDAPRLLVNERQHLVDGCFIAVARVDEELGNTRRG